MRKEHPVSTTNACKMCTPMGAALAFRGIENAVPFLHGSQGCATYMRRYIISHYREPIDIASSALGEKNAVYGGGANLKQGLLNVMKKYPAEIVGIATTCLTETIGDDVPMLVHEFKKEFGDLPLPALVHVSTPSYSGTHMEGWHAAVKSLVEQLVLEASPGARNVNIMPGFISPADLRMLKDIAREFGISATLLPDISDTLDGPSLEDYHAIPTGGTPVAAIRAMSGALGTIELGDSLEKSKTAGDILAERFDVPLIKTSLPIGLRNTDAFMDALSSYADCPVPERYVAERGRLVDAMVDGHKYVFGKKAVVYGEEDFVVGMISFLTEIGVRPVLAATGSKSKSFAPAITRACEGTCPDLPVMRTGADFYDIQEEAGEMKPDFLLGHSKGYKFARSEDIPLIRVGFPIHDRFGGQRTLHIGYSGALSLLDSIINTLLERQQTTSAVGYGYL